MPVTFDLADAFDFKEGGAVHLECGVVLNAKLRTKLAKPAREGIDPFTKEPCVFKPELASTIVRVLPREAVN